MKVITDLKEKQSIAFGILKYFKEFCQKNNIQFFLAYGTLLGAARHKGFIPWDDDVDIMMLRSEYKKLLACMECNSHPYYKLLSMHNNIEYFAPLAKLYDDRTLLLQEYGQDEKVPYGVYIDVYIIDNMPDDYGQAAIQYKKAEGIRAKWGLSVKKISAKSSNVIRYIARVPVSLVMKMIGYKHFLKKYDELASQYDQIDTHHKGIIIYGEGLKKEYFEATMFLNPSIISFEGIEFAAPSDIHGYLTQMYGDYMTLPPVEQRKVHPNKVFWK